MRRDCRVDSMVMNGVELWGYRFLEASGTFRVRDFGSSRKRLIEGGDFCQFGVLEVNLLLESLLVVVVDVKEVGRLLCSPSTMTT